MLSKIVFFISLLFFASLTLVLFGFYWYFERNYIWLILSLISLSLSFVSLIGFIIRHRIKEPQIRLIEYYEDN